MKRLGCAAAIVVASWAVGGAAQAQEQPPEQGTEECVPRCRSGFVCHQGQCVSACNPPCAEGERCSSDGECVPAEGAPPPQPPQDQGQQPPPQQDTWEGAQQGQTQQPPPGEEGAWEGAQQGQAQQQPAQQGQWGQPPEPEPAEEEPKDPGKGFRFAFSGFVLGGGEAQDDFGGSADLTPGGGLEILLEGVFSYFAIGGGVRAVFWSPDYGGFDVDPHRGVDFFVSPRFRFPFGIGEAFIASPIGASVDVPPGAEVEDDVGAGWNVALKGGAQFYLGDHLGLFFSVGGLFRGIVWSDLDDVWTTKQFMLEIGIAVL
ncbi:MAG: hypothetical protein ACODAU_03885 [Myxococcota bacterium]